MPLGLSFCICKKGTRTPVLLEGEHLSVCLPSFSRKGTIFLTHGMLHLISIESSQRTPWAAVFQSLSCIRLFLIPLTVACQAPLFFTISWRWLTFMSIESVMLAISSSATLFSSCFQSFPVSGSFLMSCLFDSGEQRTEASALASVLPVNIQGSFYFFVLWLFVESFLILCKSIRTHL